MMHLTSFLKQTWRVLKRAKENMQDDEPIVYSAAIAFFTIFSLPAILVVLTFVGSIFFAEERVRAEIVKEVADLISVKAAGEVSTVLENLTALQLDFWEVLVGIVVVVQSSSIMLFTMQKALNAVWKVKLKPGVKLFQILKYRLTALGIVVGLGFLLTLSLLLDTAVTVFSEQLRYLFEEHLTPVIRIVNTVFYLTVVLGFFTTIHKVLPDARVAWKDALAGGVITSILFLIGKEVINYVLGNVRIVGLYAAAGSLVAMLLWVFYSAVVFVLGAEITKAYANSRGRDVQPKTIAVKYEEVSQAEKENA
ncbi:YihY/virulence factor BrkB family protein [Pontibacter sp. E15-1]|uniref:YihY/virulence factor BrkB family protein n=1 Tax=Pontibacter sp. E15-1 TaxID=2919918 RepID=UPI001F4F37C7|nr:YihY/virulence factor BrkB family protein [Pontibacter sp. E15-1]MCJ8166099.1 YihY/virulence factor BrkB family protein [Pontibacter sp. E15-1]